jgi:hypothetical protein
MRRVSPLKPKPRAGEFARNHILRKEWHMKFEDELIQVEELEKKIGPESSMGLN